MRVPFSRPGAEPVDWRQRAERHQEAYGPARINEAIARLESGDLSMTKHGLRVQVRRDLGDNRSKSGAAAYWPKLNDDGRPYGCQCHDARATRRCSHLLASRLFLAWRNEAGLD